jgi:hypothetical protein
MATYSDTRSKLCMIRQSLCPRAALHFFVDYFPKTLHSIRISSGYI